MKEARRLLWVLALLALLFAPARLADAGNALHAEARTVSAAALAPTVTSADLARAEPVARPTDDGIGRAAPILPAGTPARAALLFALGVVLAPPILITFDAGGVEGGEVTVGRNDLADADWTVEVPDQVAATLHEGGVPRSP